MIITETMKIIPLKATFLCKLQFCANAWDSGMLPEASNSTICRPYISGQYIQQQDQNAQWSSTKTSKCLWNLDESFYNASFSHNFANTQNKVFDNVNKYLCRYRKKPRNSLP